MEFCHLLAHGSQVIREELPARRWKESDLTQRAKSGMDKVKMAVRLREETLVTVKWIASWAGIETASYVNHRLYRWRKGTLAHRT